MSNFVMEVEVFEYYRGCKSLEMDFECTGCNDISFQRFHTGLPVLWCSWEDYIASDFPTTMTLSWPKRNQRVSVHVKAVPEKDKAAFAYAVKQAALDPARESVYEQFHLPRDNEDDRCAGEYHHLAVSSYCGCKLKKRCYTDKSRYASLFMGACPRLFALMGVQEALNCECPLKSQHEGSTITLRFRAVLSRITTSLPTVVSMELSIDSAAIGLHDALHYQNRFAISCLRDHLVNTPVVNGLQLMLDHKNAELCSTVVCCTIRANQPIVEQCSVCLRNYRSPLLIKQFTDLKVVLRPRDSPKISGQFGAAAPLAGLDRVGGLDSVIEELLDIAVLPLLAPWMFLKLGIEPAVGVLLHGTHGVGKSFVMESLFEEIRTAWWRVVDRLRLRYAHHFAASRQPLKGAPTLSRIDVASLTSSQSKQGLVFARGASWESGSIVFLDAVDTLWANSRHSWNAWQERANIERQLVDLFEKNTPFSKCGVIIVATCCDPKLIPESLRRAGRFDREIELVSPSTKGRVMIMEKLLHGVKHNLSSHNIEMLARGAQAFVPADLQLLCITAGRNAVRRLKGVETQSPETRPAPVQKQMDAPAPEPETSTSTPEPSDLITLSDFQEALTVVKPSSLKQMMVEVPKVSWSDIGGYENVKHQLQECVEWPIKYESLFSSYGITAPRGILLYGPPGCSKTLLAKAVATESSMNFLAVKGPELYSMWVGESERGVRNVFATARRNAPCIIFFDEIDALGASRRRVSGSSGVENRVLNQMLNEMDGICALKQIVVIGATNRPDILDPALLRPGRLDRLVLVSLPDVVAREQIIQVHLRGVEVADLSTVEALDLGLTTDYELKGTSQPLSDQDTSEGSTSNLSSDGSPLQTTRSAKQVDTSSQSVTVLTTKDSSSDNNDFEAIQRRKLEAVKALACRSDGYTGAELAMICRESVMLAVRERIAQLKQLQDTSVAGDTAQTAAKDKMTVRWSHLTLSLGKIRPRVSPAMVDSFRAFETTVQSN